MLARQTTSPYYTPQERALNVANLVLAITSSLLLIGVTIMQIKIYRHEIDELKYLKDIDQKNDSENKV